MIKTYKQYSLEKQTKIIHHIADHLSKQNLDEVRLLCGEDALPFRIIFECAQLTKTGFVLFDEFGVPHGIGGIQEDRNIWFLLTEESTQAMRVSWLKNGRKWFNEQLEEYHSVYGYCWSKNELSMKWMRWLGFDFAPIDGAATKEINGEKFLYFQKNI